MAKQQTEDLQTTLDRLESSILRGTFPYVRLCTTDPMDKPIVAAKKTKGKPDLLKIHWSFIRQKIERELPPGTYILECSYDSARKNLHQYGIVKPEDYKAQDNGVQLPPIIQGSSNENDLKNLKMTPDKILELVRENAELKAENKYIQSMNQQLSEKIVSLQDQLLEQAETLDDQEKPSELERVANAFRGILPEVMPMADRFMAFKEKELQMKYGKPKVMPSQNPTNQQKQIPRKRTVQQQEQQPAASLEEQANILGTLLDGTDEQYDQAQEILDELEDTDPARYAALCQMLDIQEEDGGQQQ